MTRSELDRLRAVPNQYATVEDRLRESMKGEGPNSDTLEALTDLERTYLLRFWAVAEAVIRERYVRARGHEPQGLRHSVEALLGSGFGNETTQDPATSGVRTDISWADLLTRDRNLLAHERPLPTALGMDRAPASVEAFLYRIGKTGAPPT